MINPLNIQHLTWGKKQADWKYKGELVGHRYFACVTNTLLWEDNLHQKSNSANQQLATEDVIGNVDRPVGPFIQVALTPMAD